MTQAQQGPLATFAGMLASYGTYTALTDDEKRAYLQARASFKHPGLAVQLGGLHQRRAPAMAQLQGEQRGSGKLQRQA